MATLGKVVFALACAGLAGIGTVHAGAQPSCALRTKIVSALGERYKEAPIGIGLMQPGRVMELLVSDSGSWTLLVTGPEGQSCVLAAGESWEAMPMPVKGNPA